MLLLAALVVLAVGCSGCADCSGRCWPLLLFWLRWLFWPLEHLEICFLFCRDDFPATEASLDRNFSMQGWIFRWKIIPAQTFLRLGMISSEEIHPCSDFPAIRDDFFRGNSSLPEHFCDLGWFLPRKFIPAQTFLRFRMISSVEIHPYPSISAIRDDFFRGNSSLPEHFCDLGWFLPWKFIPARAFLRFRMISSEEIHLWPSISAI